MRLAMMSIRRLPWLSSDPASAKTEETGNDN